MFQLSGCRVPSVSFSQTEEHIVLHPTRAQAMLARRAFAPYLGPLCRPSLSTSGACLARNATSAHRDSKKDNSVVVNTSSNAVGQTAEQWTEVVDKPTGQLYYWNQQTGASCFLHACEAARLSAPCFTLCAVASIMRANFQQQKLVAGRVVA